MRTINDQSSNFDEIRRESFLHTVTPIFAKRGFEAPTMSELAEACHCERRTLYHYFSGKEDLFWSAAVRSYGMLVERFRLATQVWESCKVPSIDRIRSWALTFHEFSIEFSDDFILIMKSRETSIAMSNKLKDINQKSGSYFDILDQFNKSILSGLSGLGKALEIDGVCQAGTGDRSLWELLGVLIALIEFSVRYRGGGTDFPFGNPEGIRNIIDKQISMVFQAGKMNK